jgi:imidazolonepropionase-like amidohydrolase
MRMLEIAAVIAGLGLVGAFALGGQRGGTEGAQKAADMEFAIQHARIFDGERVIAANSVWVRDGKIVAVGKDLKVTAGIREIDGKGDTLLPGLIDAHTHDWGDSPNEALRFGVTTELNMAGPPSYVFRVKQEERDGNHPDYADLFSAGNVVTVAGGHGTEYGIEVPTLKDAAEAQAFVDARIAEGSDYIKIIYEDGKVCGRPYNKLSKEEMAAAIAAAHRRGKLAVVHISTEEDARDAISSGADGIAHLFLDKPPSAELTAMAKEHHAFVITTLTTLYTSLGTPAGAALVTDARLAPLLSEDVKKHLGEKMPFVCSGSFHNGLLAAKKLRDVGVVLLAGTDAPSPGDSNGVSLHQEMEFLVQGGFTPAEAIAAATVWPAKEFHLEDRGRIAVGLRADLMLVRGDPTANIEATRDIVSIWKAGVEEDRRRGLKN